MAWAQQHANAVLAAWYPGESGGQAIAQTLTGENNPAGRLPITFYRSVKDLPDFSDYSMANRTYRYFKGNVLYPFGFGLSYSTFSYGKPQLDTNSARAGDTVRVKVSLKNTSALAGDEVAELYVTPPHTALSPRVALEGFQRVYLAAGEERQLVFELTPAQLSSVDAAGQRIEDAGDYLVYIGGGQPATGATGAHLHITGDLKLPN